MPPKPTIADLDHAVAIAVDDEHDVRSAVFAKIVFFEIKGDIRVHQDELPQLMGAYGIDQKKYMPGPIKAGQILLTILKPKGAPRVAVLDGRRYDLEFRPQVMDGGAIAVQLVRIRNLTDDERARRALARGIAIVGDDWKRQVDEWEMVPVARFGWDANLSAALTEPDIYPEHASEYPYDSIIDEVYAEFEERRQFYAGGVISTMVTNILKDMMGVRVRPSGGVWIIGPGEFDAFERLKAFVLLLDSQYRPQAETAEDDKGEKRAKSEFASVNLISTDKESIVFVRGKIEDQVIADLRDAATMLYDLGRAGQAPRPKELRDAIAARGNALDLFAHYSGIVGGELDQLKDGLSLFDRALAAANAKAAAAGSAEAAVAP